MFIVTPDPEQLQSSGATVINTGDISPNGFMPDMIHLTEVGNREAAEKISEQLLAG